jgi:hypothetical protein
MRKITALAAAGLLALTMTAPVAAQDGYVGNITVDQVTINQRTGEVFISATGWCNGLDYMGLEIQGQMRQVMGRKGSIQGGIWGGVQCEPNGPAQINAGSIADWGVFGTGWATIQFGVGWTMCNDQGCWWEDHGGIPWTTIKVVKK